MFIFLRVYILRVLEQTFYPKSVYSETKMGTATRAKEDSPLEQESCFPMLGEGGAENRTVNDVSRVDSFKNTLRTTKSSFIAINLN